MKSIYDVYVTVTSQEQADRLKGICLEYGLPIWDMGFDYFSSSCNFLTFNNKNKIVAIFSDNLGKTQITESDFLELAKEFKNQ